MQEHGSLPRARRDGLLEETVGEELLLYDQETHTAHSLSPIAACVWRHCDGERSVTNLAAIAGASEALVVQALSELREKGLLAAEPELAGSQIHGESRREAIGRVARYGAAAATGSLIVSATAATPAMASSKGTLCCQCEQTGTKKGCILCSALPAGKTCLTYCETTFGVNTEGFLTGTTCEGTGCR